MNKERLKELAKKRGLDIAEEAAGNLGELAIDILKEVVAETENAVDDVVFASLESIARAELAKLVDKIDGEQDLP
jgi:hypothetical protein